MNFGRQSSGGNYLWSVVDRLTTVAVAAAAVSVIWASIRANPASTASTPRTVEDVTGSNLTLSLADSIVKGDADAQIVLVEFSDFQCPACGLYARETYPQVQRNFVETGKVRYAFLNNPLVSIHPLAFEAAVAASCASKYERFWPMHDQLFINQRALGKSDLVRYATSLGIQEGAFLACLDQSDISTTVKEHQAQAARLGVRGTPAFFVARLDEGGPARLLRKINGSQPYAVFETVLNSVL